MSVKNCIFHIPYYLDLKWPSGSNIRPIKMIKAFESIGYNVDIVMGYAEERKSRIESIKNKIKSGVKYDFVYSESSTEPTLLTEKNHMPKYPLLDFSFLKHCKSKSIPIGLFYRDIDWQFKVYEESLSFLTITIAKIFYRYDLIKYKNILDIFYLPSENMMKYVPGKYDFIVEELPPAIDVIHENNKIFEDDYINLFYVGGIGELYNLEKLFQLVNKKEYIKFTVCCRKNEWESNKNIYEKYLNDRIKIIHKSGEELLPYFEEADIFSLFFEPIEYRKFAMPVKLFEYLAYKKPIISTNGTATGDFVEKNSIGWCSDYSVEDLSNIFDSIYYSKEEYFNIVKNIDNIINKHTWKARAIKVVEDLTNLQ
ncbi:glycosyltransferase family 4 protein [Clostridium botulinum]|nr:glycosyltransferase family 4 protein [Clostridium botulinum]